MADRLSNAATVDVHDWIVTERLRAFGLAVSKSVALLPLFAHPLFFRSVAVELPGPGDGPVPRKHEAVEP